MITHAGSMRPHGYSSVTDHLHERLCRCRRYAGLSSEFSQRCRLDEHDDTKANRCSGPFEGAIFRRLLNRCRETGISSIQNLSHGTRSHAGTGAAPGGYGYMRSVGFPSTVSIPTRRRALGRMIRYLWQRHEVDDCSARQRVRFPHLIHRFTMGQQYMWNIKPQQFLNDCDTDSVL